MGKKGKRLLSLLLAVFLLLGTAPASVLAEGTAPGCGQETDGGYSSAMLESREGEESGVLGLSVASVFGASSAKYAGADMYSQLTTRQKACYDAIAEVSFDRIESAAEVEYSGKTYHRVTVQVAGMNDVTMSGSFVDGKFYSGTDSKSEESSVYTDICSSIVALRYDRPDILWIAYMRYGYQVDQMDKTTAKITGVILDFSLEYGGKEKDMQETMLERAKRIAEKASAETDTYSRVMLAHDLLCENNSYSQKDTPVAHTAYSALVGEDSYQPLCDGYAKAFKLVCDYMDIPCVTPSSGDHMWNNVKMDDNEWYNIDLAWDDADDEITYWYFLVGSHTEVNGTAFCLEPEHIEENPYHSYYKLDASGMLQQVSLKFPVKSKTAYVYLGEDYTPLTFPDVKRSDWYYEYVEAACAQGLFAGDSDGYFWPDRNITRAEFATVLARAMCGEDGFEEYSCAGLYSDVAADGWYAHAIGWAHDSGYMLGDDTGTFRPDDPISREEICVTLARTWNNEIGTTDFKFSDDAKIAGWSRAAVYQCYVLGIVSGDEYGFRPQDKTPRKEAVAIFTRYTVLNR